MLWAATVVSTVLNEIFQSHAHADAHNVFDFRKLQALLVISVQHVYNKFLKPALNITSWGGGNENSNLHLLEVVQQCAMIIRVGDTLGFAENCR